MSPKSNVLVIIPARGGSKGIPRKNLRPLGGKPLLWYSIQTAISSSFNPDVFVSTDDEEIAHLASELGAGVLNRPSELGQDATTLDPVIFDAYSKASKLKKASYELIVTLQPTSPLLSVSSLDEAIHEMVQDSSINTTISVVNETHLSWTKKNGKAIPLYSKRVNRQSLPPQFKETGGFLICRSSIISPSSRIQEPINLKELAPKEAIDIDTYIDWSICEYYLKRKKILFVILGNHVLGLGHVYNSLLLAHEILDHEISFLVTKDSELALKKISEHNYPVAIQEGKLKDHIDSLDPDVVINDILDTEENYILDLKRKGYKVINFEDLGEGARHADLVFNAIYPEKEKLPGHYFGPSFFCAREEFIMSAPITINTKVRKVLLTFGGVDPNNLTKKVLSSIYSYCEEKEIEIEVILGLGYTSLSSLKSFPKIHLHRNVKNISSIMKECDIAFTSAGRTIYELALLGIPSMVLAQNEREQSHYFASSEFGFKNLGLGLDVEKTVIKSEFEMVFESEVLRKEMQKKMLISEIKEGRAKVIRMIKDLF